MNELTEDAGVHALTEDELRKAICDEARSWIGTRYHDYAGVKAGRATGKGGVDCAFFPLRVYQATGFIDKAYKPEWYSPQQWLNSPSQTDKYHLRVVDETMLKIVQQMTRRELDPGEEPGPGDLMLCQVVNSWTHGAIVIEWPGLVLHPLKKIGVCGSHALEQGFWARTPKRFFTMFPKKEKK
jgi:cell wall-associated NlpC family hydrolase